MPRISNPERIQKLEQQAAKIDRELRKARNAEKKQERAIDARRKIIAGALALEHMEKNPGSDFGKTLFRLLDEYTRPHERHLFAFLPARDAPAPAPETAPDEPNAGDVKAA